MILAKHVRVIQGRFENTMKPFLRGENVPDGSPVAVQRIQLVPKIHNVDSITHSVSDTCPFDLSLVSDNSFVSKPHPVAFLMCDGDLYSSTKTCLDAGMPALLPKGWMYHDDMLLIAPSFTALRHFWENNEVAPEGERMKLGPLYAVREVSPEDEEIASEGSKQVLLEHESLSESDHYLNPSLVSNRYTQTLVFADSFLGQPLNSPGWYRVRKGSAPRLEWMKLVAGLQQKLN